MKIGSTLFLRFVLAAIALSVLGVLVIVLPVIIGRELTGDFDYAPILLGLYPPAVPFFVALNQSKKLLDFIDANQQFSDKSAHSFKVIKSCALIISGFFLLGLPYIFRVADQDDAPGLVLMGLVVIFASLVIGTFAGLLQKLIESAVEIKSENDLTV